MLRSRSDGARSRNVLLFLLRNLNENMGMFTTALTRFGRRLTGIVAGCRRCIAPRHEALDDLECMNSYTVQGSPHLQAFQQGGQFRRVDGDEGVGEPSRADL